MNHSPIAFQVCHPDDAQGVSDFLYSIRDELYFAERHVAAEITDLLFTRGCVFTGVVNNEIAAVIGALFGEPAQAYANKEVGFIYVAGLAKPYRGTAAFRTGFRFVLERFQMMGLQEVRFHALETDARLNAMYSSFARPIGKERNRRGLSCVLYGRSIEDALATLNAREKRRHIYNPTPHAHHRVSHSYHE